MSGSRVLWGQVAIVLLIVLTAIWCATEWTAWRLGFQGQLRGVWFEVAGWPIYYPPLFFWWWYCYDAYAPSIFIEGAFIAVSGGFISIVVAIALSVIRAREAKNVATYGSARWADAQEIKAAGLLGPDGVLLGRLDGDYLRHDGPEHVLCFAPTRSGKGVGLVVPTLLTWPGSTIIHDIKGENWGLTAGFRARHGRVLLFDPTDPASSAYNPLLEVRRGDKEVRDVQNIADILVDPEGALDKRNHWEKTSHSLLVGAILHVLYAEPDKTLAGVANFLSDPKRPVEATLRAMMNTPHLGEAGVHPVIASSARELLNKSDNERSGVLSTAMSFLGLYRDPVVAKVTARCDWRIADLVTGERPVSLYLVVPPSDINRTKPLIRLLLNQVGRRLTEDLKTSANRHRLLLMLDEFPALGRLDFFESALAFMAGYGIKSFLIAQSLNQIEKAYGANNSVLDNCHVRVAFATNDERTAKRVSDALGTATEMRDSTNYAGHRLSPWLGHLMVSRQETARPLLTPGEVMQLPPADELLLVAGVPPVRAKKARYYEDARFKERILPPPKAPAATAPAAQSADDWSTLAIPAASAGATSDNGNGVSFDPANAGIRREPELPKHEEIAPPERSPLSEFDVLDDDPDVEPPAVARALPIEEGDLIVAARGATTDVCLAAHSWLGAFISLDLYLVRPNSSKVDPGYLAAFFDLPATQTVFSGNKQGSGLARLPKDALDKLVVPLPPMATQRLIADLARSLRDEAELMQRLAALNSTLGREALARAFRAATTCQNS
ncbi:IncP-type conjugal transfer protein TraG [Xanthobacter autotrophicus]|uniref:IncP-type conjugal transfer protein TraG n=1 Tax=Xanthobacter autotrophicus TaxID=280 RepID=UPI00372745B0